MSHSGNKKSSNIFTIYLVHCNYLTSLYLHMYFLYKASIIPLFQSNFGLFIVSKKIVVIKKLVMRSTAFSLPPHSPHVEKFHFDNLDNVQMLHNFCLLSGTCH